MVSARLLTNGRVYKNKKILVHKFNFGAAIPLGNQMCLALKTHDLFCKIHYVVRMEDCGRSDFCRL